MEDMGLLEEAPFLLEPVLPEYTMVTLINKVQVDEEGDEWEKRRADIPKLNQLNKELIANVVLEFRDAALKASRLALDAPKCFSKFREVLDEPFRSAWDTVSTGEPETMVGFNTALNAFLQKYFESTDLVDQKTYLSKVRKPYKLDCSTLSSRLEKINKMMWLLDYDEEDPDDLPLDDDALKTLFFQMMPQTWQLDFGAIDLEITDDNVSFARVVRFMKKKEKADKLRNKTAAKKRSREEQLGPYTGKRARGRGGRNGRQGGRQHGQGNREPRNDNGRGGRGRGRGGRGGSRGGGRGGRGQNGNCPFPGHAGNDWADCYGNPESPNYRPGFQLYPDGRPNGGNGGNNRRENEDAHVNDETSAANNNGAVGEDSHWLDGDIMDQDE